eukprot:5225124-Alexandrium_andersonii.AAC.1
MDVRELTPLVHGTFLDRWEQIREDGLSCMRRNHIHCITSEPWEWALLGMKEGTQVAIYLDAERALSDGC